ncbi:Extracellular matrix regulatory protein A [subsurface metagenome]
MVVELIRVGFSNILAMNRVIAMAPPNSLPIKPINQEGKYKVIDMTNGRRTKAVIFTDSRYIILAALTPETIADRLQASREGSLLQNQAMEKTC